MPPSRETAARRSVLRVNDAVEVAAKMSFAMEGEVVAVNVFERRRAVVASDVGV